MVLHSNLGAFAPLLPRGEELKGMTAAQLHALFSAQAEALKHHMQSLFDSKVCQLEALLPSAATQEQSWSLGVADYINKATQLTDRLGIADTPGLGNVA